MAGRSPRERGVAVLPSWRARSEVDLLDGPAAPGFAAAGEALANLLPPARTVLEARQVALASYTREGFEAAAVTAVGVRMAAVVSATEVPRRTLHLRFDRPYAVVAVAVRPEPEVAGAVDEGWYGLPVFSAWVAEPAESS
jgi:hypothetical protein